jgi:hypothetical protein
MMAQDTDIAAAYLAGRHAAEHKEALDRNPYYQHTEEWDAWVAGWVDRTRQLKRAPS